MMNIKPKRLHVVDALRGFAIVSIMLLHNIEHFDFSFHPDGLPEWMVVLDGKIWNTLFFLFGGKVYAIFSLLFGLTFFIQNNNQEKFGNDFRPRFAWRMALLFVFGMFNSLFFEGDILTIYAVIGLFIIPFARMNSKAVFISAVILMLQPVEWIKFFTALDNPTQHLPNPASWAYFGNLGDYLSGKSFLKTIAGNITNGKIAVVLWSWEKGRIFQTLSLFLFGMLAGRKGIFDLNEKNIKFWKWSLGIAVIYWIPMYYLSNNLRSMVSGEAILRPLTTITESLTNMGFMMILVSGFVLLYKTSANHVLKVFAPMGKMSLSNYIFQSILGSFIYYGFGLGLYAKTGSTYALSIGIILAILQGMFSSWWFKKHKYGPLEKIWHQLTWIGYKNKTATRN